MIYYIEGTSTCRRCQMNGSFIMHVTTGVVAFAFGTDPCNYANEQIVRYTEDYAWRFDGSSLPIYTQSPEYLKFDNLTFPISRVSEEPGKPARTLRIARFAVTKALEEGLHHLVVVCAKPHIARCRADMQLAVEECGGEITFNIHNLCCNSSRELWWDPSSSQPWVRGPRIWEAREFLLSCLRRWPGLYTKIVG